MKAKWPNLTEAMIIAACEAHYGKGNTHIDGIDLTADGINYTFRDGFKRMWEGAKKASSAARDNGWISVKEALPPSSAALDDPSLETPDIVLMTNNITGCDRMGRMSHVWIGTVQEDEETKEIYGYSNIYARIYNVTHWKPIN